MHDVDTSPKAYARAGGVLYLIIIVLGLFGEVGRGGLIVTGDPAATAVRIKASESLWRATIAGNLVHLSCAVALTAIFYALLRPVRRTFALMGAFFDLASIVVEAVSKLALLAALFLLGRAEYLRALEPAQREALSYLSIRLHAYGFGLSLIFFGCGCLVFGYLIARSQFLPRVLGVLLQVAGACYLANSFALLAAPRVADAIFPLILVPAFVGEASLCVWLIVKGVDVERWRRAVG